MIKLSDLKKALGLTLIVALSVSGFFLFAEPISTQAATVASVVVTLSVTAGVSLTVDSTTTALSPGISISQNTSVATSTFVVSTNDYLGYSLNLTASTTAPAMQSASSSIPDVTVTPTLYSSLIPANSYGFGFSAYSTTSPSNVPTGTWGTQTTGCANGAGVPSTGLLYRGFAGNTPILVASNSSTTTPAGTAVVVCYVVGQNNSYIPSGSYTATITATATTK